MSKHSTSALTMRDALYEAPGPKMRAKIRIGTAISLVAVAVLVALVLQRFYVTGQLSVHYWFFFTHLTTWKFLLAGFEGTVKVALTAGAIALVLGLALMLGRTSDIKPLQLVCRVLTDFFRGVPSLLFIYFFFLVLPQYKFIIPSLISQLVVVVKDTTVAYVVSYPDLMQNARVLITNYDALVSVYLVIAVIYILINVAINKAAVYVSHKTGATIIR